MVGEGDSDPSRSLGVTRPWAAAAGFTAQVCTPEGVTCLHSTIRWQGWGGPTLEVTCVVSPPAHRAKPGTAKNRVFAPALGLGGIFLKSIFWRQQRGSLVDGHDLRTLPGASLGAKETKWLSDRRAKGKAPVVSLGNSTVCSGRWQACNYTPTSAWASRQFPLPLPCFSDSAAGPPAPALHPPGK